MRLAASVAPSQGRSSTPVRMPRCLRAWACPPLRRLQAGRAKSPFHWQSVTHVRLQQAAYNRWLQHLFIKGIVPLNCAWGLRTIQPFLACLLRHLPGAHACRLQAMEAAAAGKHDAGVCCVLQAEARGCHKPASRTSQSLSLFSCTATNRLATEECTARTCSRLSVRRMSPPPSSMSAPRPSAVTLMLQWLQWQRRV